MNALLSQIILARRSPGAEDWTNILFVVVLAVFWIVASIIKAKAKKPDDQQQQTPPKPAHRPPARSSAAREQSLRQPQRTVGPAQPRQHRPGVQQARTKLADLKAAARKFAAEAEQAFRVETAQAKPPPKRALPRPQPKPHVQPDIQQLPEYTSKVVKGLAGKRVATAAEMPQVQHLSELLSDYASPDDLRRAILHYEILGKPLSLRNPSEQAIGL
jgi:hypothetical protein